MTKQSSVFNQLSDLFNPRHFYNTTREVEKVHEAKAKTQDDRVMETFKMFSGRNLSPDKVHEITFGSTIVPITSTRRAISTLERMGLIEKSGEMVIGQYGKKTNTWRLRRSSLASQPQLF